MAIPTFSSFQTAYRALQASQTNIDTAGHNIANIDTDGYTRQRVDLNSISNSGFVQKYSLGLKQAGSGVEVGAIKQIRDPFLDARYRTQNTETQQYDTMLKGLSDLENIMDEIETGSGLQNELTNFLNQLQNLSKTPTNADIALVVRTAAQQISQMINVEANLLSQAKEQQVFDLKNVVVDTDFNSIVKGIADLNSQIRKEQLYGNIPNELYDKRNMMLDELSGIANIKVTTSPEFIPSDAEVEGSGIVIENLTVSLYDPNTSTYIGLVRNDSFNTLKVNYNGDKASISMNKGFTLDGADGYLEKTPDNLDYSDITKYISGGKIKAHLDLINGNGTYADTSNNENSFKGVPYYTNALDTFAREFAGTFNELNKCGGPTEKPLFSPSDGSSEIKASNLAVSNEWMNDPAHITTTDGTSGQAGGADNIVRMISAMNSKNNIFESKNGTTMFKGSFNEYLTGMAGELGLDVELITNYSKTSDSVLNSLFNSRESISGVLLNEEGVNLMAFQKSYNAASRYFTTLDEALDKLINGTGIVGR